MSEHNPSRPSTCKCEPCRRARNTKARRAYQRRTGAPNYGPADRVPPHGTRARYVRDKCRCEPCRQANREHARQRYQARETVHRNLARADDLEALDRSLVARGKALEASPRPDAAARLDEIIRLRSQIALIDRARVRAVKA